MTAARILLLPWQAIGHRNGTCALFVGVYKPLCMPDPPAAATIRPGCKTAGQVNRQNQQREAHVQTLDEMLSRNLLTAAQHGEIESWITNARTPEAIRQMPAPLWRTLELASVLMDVDADLTQPPLLSASP
jgi:hypothetical protein